MQKALAGASALKHSPTLRAWAAGLVAGSLAVSACVSRAAAPAVVFPLDTESFDHLPVAATVQSHHPTSSVGIPISVVQISVWADIKYPSHLIEQFEAGKGEDYLQMEVTTRQWEFRVRYPSPERLANWSDKADRKSVV